MKKSLLRMFLVATVFLLSLNCNVTQAALPAPWTSGDVGAVAATGSATYESGTFTVQGSGWNIWSTADEFRFVYQQITGDATITARITSITNPHQWTKGGVMMRETLTSNSPNGNTFLAPKVSNGSKFSYRTTAGATSSEFDGPDITAPYWLRMERTGNTFTGYVSADGNTWTTLGSTTINMSSTYYVGLSVSSLVDGTLATGTFDNVSVQTNVPVTGISVSPTVLTLDEGQTSDLTETISPTNATDQSVTWSSNNTSVATVDANGLVTAISAGNATITVTTTDGGFTATCDVTVNVPVIPVTGVSLAPATITIEEGECIDLTETVAPANATDKSVTWSSSNTSVVVVDANGLVCAVSAGNATITVTTIDGSFTATCDVTVNVAATNLALNKPITVSAYQDDEFGYKPGENLVDGDVSDDARWSASGFPQWAEIDLGANYDLNQIDLYPYQDRAYQYIIEAKPDGGSYTTIVDKSANTESADLLVSPVSVTARYVKITVSGLYGSSSTWVSLSELSVWGTVPATVSVTGVSLSSTSLSLEEGQTADLDETVSPVDATDKTVSWSSNNTSVATVDANGLVTAVSSGSATITVTTIDGGFTANCDVTVTVPGALPSPWASGDVGAVAATGSATYAGGTFTVQGSGANIYGSADEFHYVYQQISGDAIITARVASITNTYQWTKGGVMMRETLNANSMNGNTFVAPIASNGTKFSYRTTTGGSSSEFDGPNVTAPYWLRLERSGNTFTGSVSADGTTWTTLGSKTISMSSTYYVGLVVSSLADGTLATGTFDNVSVTTASTVPVTGISVSPTTLTLDEGQTSDLTETVSPANATDQSVTWTSNNTPVATVDANGLVTAVSAGSATITVTTNDGGFMANSAVTVNAAPPAGSYYCDPISGSMSNNGSQGSPWSTLEAVFAAGKTFQAGDVIYLLSGNHGAVTIQGTNSDNVIITAAPGESPEVDYVKFVSASKWVVSNIEFSPAFDPTSNDKYFVRMDVNSTYNTIDNCTMFSVLDVNSASEWSSKAWSGFDIDGPNNTITNNDLQNIAWGFRVDYTATNTTGNYNTITNLSYDGIQSLASYCAYEYNTIKNVYNIDTNHDDFFQCYSYDGSSVGTTTVYGVVLRGNTFISFTDPNQFDKSDCQGIGNFDGMYEDWVVENNLISTDMWHGITFLGAINCKIVNNTVIKNPINAYAYTPWIQVAARKASQGGQASTGNIVANNLCSDMDNDAGIGTVENNIVISWADYGLYFTDFTNFDYTTIAGSPAIDAGTSANAPSIDIDGISRPQGAGYDVGAYEFSGPTGEFNFALNKPISVSAYQDDANGYYPGENLVDGDVSDDARWSASGFPQWAEIDLGSDYALTHIDLYPYQDRAYQYIIEAKPDGGSYSTIVDRSSNTESADILTDNVIGNGRYVKITVNGLSGSTSTWVSLSELEVYGVISGGSDTLAPSVPTGLTADTVSVNSVTLSWNASTDNVVVAGYKVYTNGSNPVTVAGTSTVINGLSASTQYSFTVSAIDVSSNESAQSSVLNITTPAPDTQAPSVPTGLAAGTVSVSSVALSWNASTDNVSVTGYKVYTGGSNPVTVTGTSTVINGLSSSTQYSFTVSAIDAASNESAQSSAVNVTTSEISGGWPTISTTGPSGTLTPHSSDITTTSNGQLIENLDISGSIHVVHSNVTIRNCKFASLDIKTTTPTTGENCVVEDCELGWAGRQNFTLRRCFMTVHSSDLIRIGGGNILIEDNYLIITGPKTDGSHADIIQTYPVDHYPNLVVRHNTLYNECVATSCINAPNISIINNLIAGGANSIYGGDHQIIDNHFSTIFFPNVGNWGVYYGGSPGSVCSGNVIHETGVPINCGSSSSAEFAFEAKQEQQSVKIYPNPLHGNMLNIQLSDNEENNLVNVQIVDLTGRSVYNQLYEVAQNEVELPVNLKKGIYIISVNGEKQKLIVD